MSSPSPTLTDESTMYSMAPSHNASDGFGGSLEQMAGDPFTLMNIGEVDHELVAIRQKLTYYLMGIGGSVVCCMGTIANALSVAVLTRGSMKSSTYIYLAALAVCDSLVLFFTLLLILKDTKPPDSPHELNQFHAVLYPFVHPTAIVFQVTSIWLTLAFTVDRYIMICHPFSAERMCRRSRARKVVLCMYVGGFLFNIPRYLEHYTTMDEFGVSNSSQVFKVYGVDTTTIGNDEVFREVVHSWLYIIFVCGTPFLTLVILNAFLIRAVHLSRIKGKEINAREKHRNDTTIMLIGVIVIFLICQGPALVSRMIYAFQTGASSNRAVYTLNEVANFLVILNSAINIVPYYLFGRKFRSEFWRIFCACFFDKDELRRIVRTYSYSIDHRRMSQYNVMEMNGLGNNSNKSKHKNSAGSCTSPNVYNPTGMLQSPRNRSPVTGDRSETTETPLCLNGDAIESSERVAVPIIHYSSSPRQSLSRCAVSGRDELDGASTSSNLSPSPLRLPTGPATPFSCDASFPPERCPNGQTLYQSVSSSPSISGEVVHVTCEPVSGWSIV